MIRAITPEELPKVKECAFAFFNSSGLPGALDFDYWTGRWLSMMVDLHIGVIYAYWNEGRVVGILGGLAVRCSMTGDLEAHEAFWFVMPEYRGGVGGIKLFKAFEKWSQKRGCKRIKVAHLNDCNGPDVAVIYKRLGYSHFELAYAKEL